MSHCVKLMKKRNRHGARTEEHQADNRRKQIQIGFEDAGRLWSVSSCPGAQSLTRYRSTFSGSGSTPIPGLSDRGTLLSENSSGPATISS